MQNDYKLEDLVEVSELQSLQEKLDKVYSFPSAIIDNGGKILTAVSWQDLCVKFHRKHPDCEKECIKSDKYILDNLDKANPFISYKCPHGLIDCAAPIIIEGKHVANFFTGQFFYDKPDINFFINQANRFNFNEKEYLEALQKVPVIPKKKSEDYLEFMNDIIQIIAGLGLKNLKEKNISEKLETEKEKAIKLNDLISNITNNIIDLVSVTDIDGNIIFVSGSFSALGYKKTDLIGKNSLDFVHPDDLNFISKTFEKFINSKEITKAEYRCRMKNGEFAWMETICRFINNNEIIFSSRIITERIKYQNKLKEARDKAEDNEKNLNEAQRLANIGSWIYDPITQEPVWSREMFKIWGLDYRKGAPSYEDHKKSIHPDDWDFFDTAVQKAVTKGVPYNLDIRIIRPDNKIRNIITICKPIIDKTTNKIIALKGTNQDITNRISIERELKNSIKKLSEKEQILDNQNKEIKLHNERLESLFRIAQKNRSTLQELLDFALSEIINLTHSKIGYIYFYNEKTKKFKLNTWSKEVMHQCKVANQETEYDLDSTGCWGEAVRQRKPIIINDFSKAHNITKGTPKDHVKLKKFLTIPVIFDDKIVAVTGVANKEDDYNDSDIQQLKLMMDRVWRMSERVLLINELTLAKNKAEESDKLKTEFLNNMSHEIRTPMNGIMGFSALLNMPNLTPEKTKYYSNIISNSSKQLLKTIDDILELSTLETKQEKLYESEFCLNELLNNLFSIFNIKAKEKRLNLHLKYNSHDNQNIIISDKTKLSRIISNLLENAIRYTHKGYIEFGYSIKNKKVNIYIKDTGIGIAKENHKMIFKRFSQEEKELSRKYGGLGLGLSISKRNSKLLGGDISLDSKKGEGSIFHVNIPYKTIRKNNKKEEEKKEQVSNYQEGKKVNILIAEDEEFNFIYLQTILKLEENCEYNITHAKNGKEAVDFIFDNTDTIDIILMDIKMPIMNGLEATKKIKTKFPEIPIIAQTAYSTEKDQNITFKYGCDEFISKPINDKVLFKLINKLIK